MAKHEKKQQESDLERRLREAGLAQDEIDEEAIKVLLRVDPKKRKLKKAD